MSLHQAHKHVPQANLIGRAIAEELLVDLWGDMTTETLPTLLHRTANGSLTAIMDLVRDREADQYVAQSPCGRPSVA